MANDDTKATGPGDPLAADREGSSPGGPPEDELLRRAAAAIRSDPSLAAWLPLSPKERESLVDAALAHVASEGEAPRSALADELSRRRKRTPYVVAAAAVALAASVVLYLTASPRRPTVAPLVAYALRVEGEQTQRGDPAETSGTRTEIRPETRLTISLSPPAGAAPERDALVRVLLLRGGEAALLEVPVTRATDGAIRVEGPARDLLGPSADGEAELVVVLGRQLPDDTALRKLIRASGVAPAHLQILRQRVTLVGFSHGAVELWLGGCRHVAVGSAGQRGPPRCEVSSGGRLRFWVGAVGGAKVEVLVDGVAAEIDEELIGGGLRLTLAPPADARSLRVMVGARELARWELAPARESAETATFDRALAAGELSNAEAALAKVPADAPAHDQVEVLRRRAKLARLAGRQGEEITLREQAIALATRAGRLSAQADETVAIAYGLLGHHAFSRVAELLRALEAPARIYAEAAIRRWLVQGLAAAELGDLGAARSALGKAVELAERVDDARDREAALGPLADVLQALGRYEEADAAIEAELARGARAAQSCDRVDALTNAGWLLREHAAVRARDLAGAAQALARSSCQRLLPIALLNAAWLSAMAGDLAAAQRALAELDRTEGARDSRIVTWRLRLEGELILAEDAARAELHARDLAARAEALCSSELAYEAQLLRARAHVALGKDATAAFAAAERELERWSQAVPLGEGRATFFARHEQLAAAALPYLLQQADAAVPGAKVALATMARRNVVRFVSSLAAGGRARLAAERGAWQAGSYEQFERTLARWPGGEAGDQRGEAVEGVCALRASIVREREHADEAPSSPALIVHPIPTGVLLVSWRGRDITVVTASARAEGESAPAFAARLARAAMPALADARRVALYAHRALSEAPLERALQESGATVFHAVDVASPAARARCDAPPRALLVTNPQENLWQASASAPRTREHLLSAGYQVTLLDGAAATRHAVLAHLADPCMALLLYEGHGKSGAAVPDRIEDAMLLADGPLTATEILALPRAPAATILHGCTTAAADGLGLAHAFVLAGSSQVLASPEPLEAAAAARWSDRLVRWRQPASHAPDLTDLVAGDVPGGESYPLRLFGR